MRVEVGRRAAYALRAVAALAAYEDHEWHSARALAVETGIPARFLSHILGSLVREGVLEAMEGRRGGYRLVGDPASVPVLSVIEAAEGPLRSEGCVAGWEAPCPLHDHWQRALRAVRSELGSATVDSLRRQEAGGCSRAAIERSPGSPSPASHPA